MIAEKGNKVYTIDETQQEFYVAQGFDIKNEHGEVIKFGAGKTVSMDEHQAVLAELEELKAAKKDKKTKE